MSFKLSWGPFDDKFYNNIKTGLNTALNSGDPVPNLVDQLLVHQIELGDNPPQLALLELDPSKDNIRFVFKVNYKGNGLLELRTLVQANPLHIGNGNRRDRIMNKKLGMGPAAKPHVMPLSIIIKDIEFDGELQLALINNSKMEASFKEDPLKRVNIVTSFDEFPSAANFIKQIVEKQLRDFIMKEFPNVVGSVSIPLPTSPIQQSSEHTNSIHSINTQTNTNSPLLQNTNQTQAPPNQNTNQNNNTDLLNSDEFSLLPEDKLNLESKSEMFKNQFKKSKKKSNFEPVTTDYIQ